MMKPVEAATMNRMPRELELAEEEDIGFGSRGVSRGCNSSGRQAKAISDADEYS
jgi:hypothetical protein